MKYVIFSSGWDGMCFARHLEREGATVYLGQVQDFEELGLEKEPEDPKDKVERLAQYDGMVKRKETAKKLIAGLKKVANKDDYFLFFDQNGLYKYGQQMLDAGFTKGLFPLEEDYNLEKDRAAAIAFVEEHYPDVQIIPNQEVDSVEEAKKLVEEADVPLVLQSSGDFVPTVCPVDDVEQNHFEILAALEKNAKDYAHGKILIKEKLIQPTEITPQIIFWDGEPVYTSIDIENKTIGDGEGNGNQTGCSGNLIISTEFEDEINRIAFPAKVFEMAKERKGIFVFDISLFFTETGIYFGEFCSGRFGYDASMTEMTMSGGVLEYFESLKRGENPLKSKFGVGLRVFNLNRQKGQEINVGNEENTFLFEATMKDDKLVSVGNGWDLGVITGRGNTVEEAVENVYDNLSTLTFKEKYTRTKEDFLADYPTSIVHRFKETNEIYYSAPSLLEPEKKDEIKLEKIEQGYKKKIEGFKKQLKELMYGQATV